MAQEVWDRNTRITERAFEGEAIHLVVEGKDDTPPVRVFHLDVAAFAVNLYETHAL